jgi:hypothetical protein
MKKIFIIACISFCAVKSYSQNIGIGTTEPMNKLQVNGNLLVNTPAAATNTAPTVPQTKTMVNASTITFASTDSTGRMYDPGGPAGNYNANLLANADIAPSSNIGIEITVESMQLGTGDSLIIREFSGSTVLLAVGNNYSSTGKWIFNTGIGSLYITFKSNADASVGSGFSLLFRRLYGNSQSLPDVTGYAGKALFFDTKSGAFRSGSISNQAKGYSSTAMGDFTTASGDYSTALGSFTTASGDYSTASGLTTYATGDRSTAMGNSTTAGGYASTALGNITQAQGNNSTALGYKSKAIGIKSTAFGDSTIASGDNATALGYHTLASDDYSTAIGAFTTASGINSTAIGNGTIASGAGSTAMGYATTASGASSTTMGYVTTASGGASTAMGAFTTASGNNSTAMGYNASTNGQAYSFAIGGNGTATNCTSPNQFMTRFDNYTFWISASNYAYLLPSSNGWAYTSDKNKKERFEELDGETVLKKISKINFSSWNFKAADTRQYRHYGITAQDFYNAFGKDSYGKIGNDSTVSPLDLLGVAYSAIKALEKRTAAQQQLNLFIGKENEILKADNLALQKQLDLLEKKINELVIKKEEPLVNMGN